MVLVEELRLIDQNLYSLGQILQQRLARLSQTGLPASNDDLLLLRREHKVSAHMIHTRSDQRRAVGAKEHVRTTTGRALLRPGVRSGAKRKQSFFIEVLELWRADD